MTCECLGVASRQRHPADSQRSHWSLLGLRAAVASAGAATRERRLGAGEGINDWGILGDPGEKQRALAHSGTKSMVFLVPKMLILDDLGHFLEV